jgi:hypothetical protein
MEVQVKQIWMMAVVGLFMIGFSSLAFTQEHKDAKQGDKICQEKMKSKSHVPTEDGGVVMKNYVISIFGQKARIN